MLTTSQVSRIQRVATERVAPLHLPTDRAKLHALTGSMAREGWIGRPLLIYQKPRGWQAITGSHRIAAARAVGLKKLPCLTIPRSVVESNGDTTRLWDALDECCEGRALLKVLNDYGCPLRVLGLMTLDVMMRDDDGYDPELYDWEVVGLYVRDRLRHDDPWVLPPASET